MNRRVRVKVKVSGSRAFTFHVYSPLLSFLGLVWTGGRVAEGVGLENRYTRKGIVGSNPTLSVFPTLYSPPLV